MTTGLIPPIWDEIAAFIMSKWGPGGRWIDPAPPHYLSHPVQGPWEWSEDKQEGVTAYGLNAQSYPAAHLGKPHPGNHPLPPFCLWIPAALSIRFLTSTVLSEMIYLSFHCSSIDKSSELSLAGSLVNDLWKKSQCPEVVPAWRRH